MEVAGFSSRTTGIEQNIRTNTGHIENSLKRVRQQEAMKEFV